jgi:hypothetical protein
MFDPLKGLGDLSAGPFTRITMLRPFTRYDGTEHTASVSATHS